MDKEERKRKFLLDHPNFDTSPENRALPDIDITPLNASETLVGAVNKVIGIYNKIAASIKDSDIKKMDIKEKINALQKLSYLHNATKVTKMSPRTLNLIKLDTSTASVEVLEAALLEQDNE